MGPLIFFLLCNKSPECVGFPLRRRQLTVYKEPVMERPKRPFICRRENFILYVIYPEEAETNLWYCCLVERCSCDRATHLLGGQMIVATVATIYQRTWLDINLLTVVLLVAEVFLANFSATLSIF